MLEKIYIVSEFQEGLVMKEVKVIKETPKRIYFQHVYDHLNYKDEWTHTESEEYIDKDELDSSEGVSKYITNYKGREWSKIEWVLSRPDMDMAKNCLIRRLERELTRERNAYLNNVRRVKEKVVELKRRAEVSGVDECVNLDKDFVKHIQNFKEEEEE